MPGVVDAPDSMGCQGEIVAGWWLSPTPLKILRKSVGMMTFPIYGKIKLMVQTTNQMVI
jgi:hypothetical protein